MENNEFGAIDTSDMESSMPEGGLSSEDIIDTSDFADDSFETFFDSFAEEENSVDSADVQDAPTTEPTDAAATTEETEAPTTEPDVSISEKIKVKVKVDHNERDVDIDPDDLPGIWQRANNFERLQKRYSEQEEKVQKMSSLAKQLGFDSIEAMIEHAAKTDRDERVQALVDEGTSREVAEDYVDRKIERECAAVKPMATEEQPEDKEQSYKDQVSELFRVRPDLKGKLKTLPSEVTRAVVEENIPLRTAYAEWEARQAKAEQDRLKKENDRFAQTAEAATRAPVRGNPDNTANAGKKPDPFVFGFEHNKW